MKRLFNPIYFFPAALALLSACAGSDSEPLSPDSPALGETETVAYTFSLNLEGELSTRDEEQNDNFYYDPDNNEYGKGHKITTLIYGVFDKNGVPTIVNDKGENPYQVKIDDYFTRAKREPVTLELVKGLEYTVVFWAQSKEGDDYFNTDALDNIVFNRPGTFLNNQDNRDAFCFRYKITQFEDTRDKKITLTRPFAQINIGFDMEKWNKLGLSDDGISSLKSSVKIENISSNFNLFTNVAIRPEGEIKKTTATLNLAEIPFNQKIDGANQYLEVRDRNNPSNPSQKYIWVSMSYALPPDYSEENTSQTAYIDITDFNLYSGETLIFKADIPSLPVLRNHRTNILYTGEYGNDTRGENISPLIWVD